MSTLSETIAKKIELDIISGIYKANEKIPNEHELIEKYSVSRGTLREAIKLLISRDIIEIRRGVGTFVKENSNSNSISTEYINSFIANSDDLISDLNEFRRFFEPIITGIAAERATDEEAKILCCMAEESQKLMKKMQKTHTQKTNDEAANEDIEFHVYIYKCCHNEYINRLIPVVETSLSYNYTNQTYRLMHRQNARADTHLRIAKAIQAHDKELAIVLSRRHIQGSAEFINGEAITKAI